MIKTRITELFGIQYPIMMSGMNYVTEPKIVAAVSNAGGLGVLACSRFSPEEMRKNIHEIRKLTDKPFGINQALRAGGEKNIQVAIEEQIKIVNYSLGKPFFINDVHKYGGKVMGTVAIAKHAVAAAKLGVDVVITTGNEAAGHPDLTPTLILLPLVASMVKIPIIAAGGFFDGKGLVAALAMGADAIAMGTRFMLTKESHVHEHFKELVLKATEQDTLISDKFDGLTARMLKTPASEKLYKSGSLNLFDATKSALEIKGALGYSWWDFMRLSVSMMKGDEKMSPFQQARQAMYVKRVQKAIFEGDLQNGLLPTGMVCGALKDMPSCKEIIDRIVKEAEETIAGLNKKCS